MTEKAYYLTTPIYYVNGKPHVGHAYTTIAADTAARWQRAKGRPVFLMTGTDEHGQKVLAKAVERGMTPKAHADDMVVHWKKMMEDLHISYDHFMRTTDDKHVACVKACLTELNARGLLYKKDFVGWYSPAAERFWTEKDLVDGKCPDTGQPVERVEESNWWFRMSAFQQPLVDHIEANPDFIRPASRRNEVLGFLRKPLADLCISRPKARMGWGIELPFDPDFVTYVWVDALLNYISEPGYLPGGHEALGFRRLWPADVQLVGKDILTTHAVYWTTLLLALDLPLPRTIYAHGWWLAADGQKMSKSLGNVLDVDLLVRNYGLDAVRYFLLREVAFGADGHFSHDGFLTRYNADLANDLGNLAHRGLSMTTTWLGGVVPAVGASTGFEDPLRALAVDVVRRFAVALDGLQFQDALTALWELVRAGNKYIDDTAPWTLNKVGDKDKLGTALRTVLEIAALAATLLTPVMPTKADEQLRKLGLTVDRAHGLLRDALEEGADLAWLDAGTPVVLGDPLFPRCRELPAEIADLFVAEPEPAPAPKPKADKAPKVDKVAAAEAASATLIAYDDFAKVALRAGTVLAAERHPSADKLLVLKVDVGEATPRQIVAGIAARFAPDALVGRKVVVVANLAPVKLRGVESQGMLLAGGGAEVVDLVGVDAPPGTVVR